MGGTEQKEKSGPPRPSYLGSLNAFQIKTKGLPWTRSRRGAVFQEICSLASPPPAPPPASQGGKASPRNRAWQPPRQPQLVPLFTFPAKQTLAAPPAGPGASSTCEDHPPRDNSSPQGRKGWPGLIFQPGLIFCCGAGVSAGCSPQATPAYFGLSAPTPARPFK